MDKPTWLNNVQTREAINLVPGFWQRVNYLKMSTAHFKLPLHEMLYSISGMNKTVKRKVADDTYCTWIYKTWCTRIPLSEACSWAKVMFSEYMTADRNFLLLPTWWGVSLPHHAFFLSPPSYLWLISVPQNKMMDLTHSLDETANVFIFEPGSTADALVLWVRLHNATVCSLACFTVVVQYVADNG